MDEQMECGTDERTNRRSAGWTNARTDKRRNGSMIARSVLLYESICVILGFSAGRKMIVALFFSSVFSFVVFFGVCETQKVIQRKK